MIIILKSAQDHIRVSLVDRIPLHLGPMRRGADRPSEFLAVPFVKKGGFDASGIIRWRDCRIIIIFGRQGDADGVGLLCLDLWERAFQVMFLSRAQLTPVLKLALVWHSGCLIRLTRLGPLSLSGQGVPRLFRLVAFFPFLTRLTVLFGGQWLSPALTAL